MKDRDEGRAEYSPEAEDSGIDARGTFRFKNDAAGAILDVDYVVCSEVDWNSRPDALDERWLTAPIRPGLILGVRVLI